MCMIRVLHIVTTMDFGGVETLLMSIYRNMDREQIQFDFLCHNRTQSQFQEEILSLGGRMYQVNGPRHGGFLHYIKELNRFFKEHPEYTIVHAHMNRDSAFALWQAKRCKIPIRISHSHIALQKYKFPYSLYFKAARKLNSFSLTHRFACSKEAGEELFGKNASFTVIPNAIQTDAFRFDPDMRAKKRAEWGADEDTLIIGHVGRFDNQKNHAFVVRVFAALQKKVQNARLVLIGGGPLEASIRDLVHTLSLEDSVVFAGQHARLQADYSAMDAFLFPSLFEGFGIVAVEAQCAGLPVTASDQVPREVALTDDISFLPLNRSPEAWADEILRKGTAQNDQRSACADIVAATRYNIKTVAQDLAAFYMENAKRG